MSSSAHTLRHCLRGLEPKVLAHLHGPLLQRMLLAPAAQAARS